MKQDSDSLEKDYLKLGIPIFLADPSVSLASQGGWRGLQNFTVRFACNLSFRWVSKLIVVEIRPLVID